MLGESASPRTAAGTRAVWSAGPAVVHAWPCSAYFAQVAIRAQVLDSRDGLPLLSSVPTVAVGWLLLAAFYVRVRFRRALVIHCFVPGLILVCALVDALVAVVEMLFSLPLPDSREAEDFVRFLALVCFLSSMFSLPSFALMMIVWRWAAIAPRSRATGRAAEPR